MDKIKRSIYLVFFSTGLILGALVGIVSFSCFVSYRIESYHNKIQAMELSMDEKDFRLKKLEETINKRKLIVKNVDIILEKIQENDGEDELTEITLKKFIKEKIIKFVGKEVAEVDAEMLWEVIDQRIMLINSKNYKLKVTKLVISETTKLWVEVTVTD